MSRIVALVFVVAAHLALLLVFTISRSPHGQVLEEGRALIVVSLSPTSLEKPVSRFNRTAATDRSPDDDVSKRASSPEHPVSPPSADTATTPRPSVIDTTSIDWSQAAELAAARQIDLLEDERRRARGFMPRAENSITPGQEAHATPPKSPEFGWSRAQTQRIEPLPQGGTLLRISERCSLVISGGLLPVCNFGKIEARGDLFEHMRDAPAAGDWKQQ